MIVNLMQEFYIYSSIYMKSNYSTKNKSKKVDWWNKDSKTGKLLKMGLENDNIDPNKPPKTIWELYPVFQHFKLSKVCVALNKLKLEMSCMVHKKPAVKLNSMD